MFTKLATVAGAITCANAFMIKSTTSNMARTSSNKLMMSDDFAFGLPGSSGPIENFDPLGFAGKADLDTMKKYREAELKHGRIAMLATLGLVFQEFYHFPIFGDIQGPAIVDFQQLPDVAKAALALGIAAVEYFTIDKGFGKMDPKSGIAPLKDEYSPGDLGFDPLGLKPEDEEEFRALATKELNNGRLAMIAVAGIVAQELVDGKTILGHFA